MERIRLSSIKLTAVNAAIKKLGWKLDSVIDEETLRIQTKDGKEHKFGICIDRTKELEEVNK